MECLFCQIAAKKVPSEVVYEDHDTIAFLDIHPSTKGHTLVIPKMHAPNIYRIEIPSLCKTMETVQKMACAIKDSLNASGINIVMNNDIGAGQDIDHAHIHIIPRFPGDGIKHPPKISYMEGEMQKIAEKIKTAL